MQIESGRIDPGDDVDYFEVEASESGTLTVYTNGNLDTVGELENSSGTRIASNDDGGSGNNFRITHSVQPGTYYVKVESFSSNVGAYTIRAESGGSPPPPGNSCTVGQVLTVGQSCTFPAPPGIIGGSSTLTFSVQSDGRGCVTGAGVICSGRSMNLNGFRASKTSSNPVEWTIQGLP